MHAHRMSRRFSSRRFYPLSPPNAANCGACDKPLAQHDGSLCACTATRASCECAIATRSGSGNLRLHTHHDGQPQRWRGGVCGAGPHPPIATRRTATSDSGTGGVTACSTGAGRDNARVATATRFTKPAATALLVVDLQPVYYSASPKISRAFPDLPANVAELIKLARDRSVHVIHIRAHYTREQSPWLYQRERVTGQPSPEVRQCAVSWTATRCR